jgi:hypothetical protein
MFENRVQRRTCGPKRDEVTVGWTKLREKKLQNSYSSPNITRMVKLKKMRLTGYVALTEETRNIHRLLMVNTERNRPLRRPRSRLVDKIKMDLGGIEWGVVGWIGLAQDRDQWRALVNTVMNRLVP